MLPERQVAEESKYHANSFRSRRQLAETLLMGLGVVLLVLGLMLVVLFTSELQVLCSGETGQCHITRKSFWIAPSFYWYHRTLRVDVEDIEEVRVRVVGLHWKEDRHTAEEFDHQRCDTVMKRRGDPQEVMLTLFSRSCGDTSLVEEMMQFVDGMKKEGEVYRSVWFVERTPLWPYAIGVAFVLLSLLCGVAYYLEYSRHLTAYL